MNLKLESSIDYLKCIMFNHDYITESKIKKMIPFNIDKLPQVGILTPDMTTSNEFVWSDKMDGERCLVITYEGIIYMYQKPYHTLNIPYVRFYHHSPFWH
jgi:hypothetical protein